MSFNASHEAYLGASVVDRAASFIKYLPFVVAGIVVAGMVSQEIFGGHHVLQAYEPGKAKELLDSINRK